MPKTNTHYWLFQSSPKVFQLKEALAADAVHSFAVKAHKKTIQKGDKIILWQSGKKAGCYALATVLSAPSTQLPTTTERSFFKHSPAEELRISLRIDYNLWNRPITKEILPNSSDFDAFYVGIPGTNFKATALQYEALIRVVEQLDMMHDPEVNYQARKPQLHALNTILEGPPGTGKTYLTVNYALSIIEGRSLRELALEPRYQLRQRYEKYQSTDQIQFITFHQSYAYEDFVEGIKPITEDGQIQYAIEAGIFKQMCEKARMDKKTSKYVLIIDEINRGNIPAIFGELISLIESDKREGQAEAIHTILPYSKTSFAVPANLYLVGTMNTSDRSVEAIDIALRRRFSFIAMPPNPILLRPAIEAGVSLEKLLTTINNRIVALLDKAFLIGHAYFMDVHTLDDLIVLFQEKIIPLLKEYFFGDLNKIGLVLGKQFFKKVNPLDPNIFSNFETDFVDEFVYKKSFILKEAEEWREVDFIRVYDPNYEA